MIKTKSIKITLECTDCGREHTIEWNEEPDERLLFKHLEEAHQCLALSHYCPEYQRRTGYARNH